jgi:hypothetical protein
MSENQDFQPMSPELGIAGSSYRLQVGRVNNFWAIRLVKGNDVLESHVFKDETEMPNGNKLTGWVLSVLTIPNINTYQIQKTIGFIRQKALGAWEDMQKKKQEAGKGERTEVALEKVPENEIKRPQAQGWVKEEAAPEDANKVDAAELSPTLAASNKAATARTMPGEAPKAVVVGNRTLQPIPFGEDFVLKPNPRPAALNAAAGSNAKSSETAPTAAAAIAVAPVEAAVSAKSIATALAKSNEFLELEKRVAILETKVKQVQEENAALRKEIALMKK